ncbi:hypothetical protein EVG20_g2601 [Dentipellis fragilis]|uniref:Non-structural maintenance of chromosomes element 1 homolog n=1 Tax=Dentipellis fragilis TaxID=205917 RepID=A0A4Y9Z9E2_9AGAM|nr:hypothetical protein EVG20_g2601 [Dentipellis fragilis]
MPSADDVPRLFLQSILSRRVVSVDLAKVLWKKSVEAVRASDEDLNVPWANDQDSWDNFLTKVNTSINPLDLEFARLHDEVTGREMFALVNRNGDEVAQIATDYSPLETAYFKSLIEQIMLAPNHSYSLSSLAALREVNGLKSSMTKTQAENVLSSFVAKGWLYKSKRGRYSLSIRTILELQPYLKSTYADEMLDCTICLEFVTRGIKCYTNNCGTQLHDHCFEAYRKTKTKCPTCDQDWAKDTNAKKLIPIGEKAAGADDGRRRTRRKSTVDDSDEEEAPEESQAVETDGESQPTQTQRRRSTRKSTTQSEEPMNIDDDDEEEEAPLPKKKGGRRRG